MEIAFLGWGSLIWDHSSDFDTKIGPWESEGPVLPVEFCRISSTRKGALVLVIDRDVGTAVNVLYTLSVRDDPEDALEDLREREKTKMKYIGFVDLVTDEHHGRDPEAVAAIKVWAAQIGLTFVAWTDLASNFMDERASRSLLGGAETPEEPQPVRTPRGGQVHHEGAGAGRHELQAVATDGRVVPGEGRGIEGGPLIRRVGSRRALHG